MNILPVLDLLDGVVVHGVAGNREMYRPIQSELTTRVDPLGVAAALRETYGLSKLYVADLNGLQSQQVDERVYAELSVAGFELTVDAGVRSVAEARLLIGAGVSAVVLALETNPSSALLDELLEEFGPDRIVFSLDLKAGELLGQLDGLPATDARSLAVSLLNRGCRRLIVLDLSAVGSESGPLTIEMCRSIREVSSNVQIISGGGIRNSGDLKALAGAGVDEALMATGLHHGNFTRRQLSSYLD